MSWKEITEINDQKHPGWRKKHPVWFSNALAGEAGEVCEAIKHMYGGGTNKKTVVPKDVAFEAFDLYVYMVMLLESLGISCADFDKISKEKLETLKVRMGYKDGSDT